MYLRQCCNAAHAITAWIACPAGTTGIVESVYIALQQQGIGSETPPMSGDLKGDDIMAYAPLALTLNGFVIPQSPARKGPGLFARALAAPVSYTHLRAHETVLDLVCRLLLEKK